MMPQVFPNATTRYFNIYADTFTMIKNIYEEKLQQEGRSLPPRNAKSRSGVLTIPRENSIMFNTAREEVDRELLSQWPAMRDTAVQAIKEITGAEPIVVDNNVAAAIFCRVSDPVAVDRQADLFNHVPYCMFEKSEQEFNTLPREWQALSSIRPN